MVAQQLIILRKQNKLTQVQVAKVLGVDRSTYNKYEKGDRQVSVDTLKKLSIFYGIPFSVLVEDESNDYLTEDDYYDSNDVRYLSQLSKAERNLIVEYRIMSAEKKEKIKELIEDK